jgi:hypothetical protein
MKKILFILLAVGLVFAANTSYALLIGGPSPIPGFGNDDNSTYFSPNDNVLAFEFFDLGGIGTGTEFGFFFENTPGTLVPIFEPADEGGELATVNFTNLIGVVFDVEDASVQSLFANQFTDIGFYLNINANTFYTDPALNPGGVDFAATFQNLGNSETYLIGFEVPGQDIVLSLDIVSGVDSGGGVVTVPEPGTLLLLGSALLGLGAYRKRAQRK